MNMYYVHVHLVHTCTCLIHVHSIIDGGTFCVQVESYKLDFEAERKDREVAHSKLADLERAFEKEKGHIDAERATYEQQFERYQQGSRKDGDLKQQKEKLERELKACVATVDKFQNDVVKSKREADNLRVEMQAKVSQVRQYQKENDRLKAQVQYVCVHV